MAVVQDYSRFSGDKGEGLQSLIGSPYSCCSGVIELLDDTQPSSVPTQIEIDEFKQRRADLYKEQVLKGIVISYHSYHSYKTQNVYFYSHHLYTPGSAFCNTIIQLY